MAARPETAASTNSSRYYPSAAGYDHPTRESSVVSHVSTGSLQLVPTSEIYGKLLDFLYEVERIISNSDCTQDIKSLIQILSEAAKSTAMLNYKTGQFIAVLTDDLLNQSRSFVEHCLLESEQKWGNNSLPIQDLYHEFCNESIKEFAMSAPLLIMTVLKCLTGQWKEEIFKILHVDPPVGPKKPRRIRINKLIAKARKSLAKPKSTEPCAPEFQPLEFRNIHDLNDGELTSLLGFFMEVGTVILGSELGPRTALRYSLAAYLVTLASFNHLRSLGAIAAARKERLQDWIMSLQKAAHEYQWYLVRPIDAELMDAAEATAVAPQEDVSRKLKLRCDVIEIVGKLIADVISGIPELALQNAVHTLTGTTGDEVETEDTKRITKAIRAKIRDLEAYLDSLEPENMSQISLGQEPSVTESLRPYGANSTLESASEMARGLKETRSERSTNEVTISVVAPTQSEHASVRMILSEAESGGFVTPVRRSLLVESTGQKDEKRETVNDKGDTVQPRISIMSETHVFPYEEYAKKTGKQSRVKSYAIPLHMDLVE